MTITKTTIKAQASTNFQVGSIEMEISDYTQEEYNQIKNFCINEAKKICNQLQTTPVKEEPKVEVQTTPAPAPRAPYAAQYNKPQQAAAYNKPYQNGDNGINTGISESQVNFLKKLGYKGDFNLTKQQASDLIKQYTGK